MAKRFIDTSFYKSPFVRGLEGSLKGLYSFIICDCDSAGIWSADFEIASVYIGLKVTKTDFENAFLKTGKAVDLNNGKYFFPDFIQHQYPKGLSEKNPAQINIIFELKKFNLIDENLKVLERPFEGSKVMVIDKDKVIGKVKVKEEKKEIFENVFLTEKQIEEAKEYFQDYFDSALKILSNYKLSSGKKYKSDYHALIGWVKDKMIKENPNGITKTSKSTDTIIGINRILAEKGLL